MKKYYPIVLYYTKKLGTEHSAVTFPMCITEIESHASQSSNRQQYKNVCREIKRLFCCEADVKLLIEKLIKAYPRRSAFIDELEKLKAKI